MVSCWARSNWVCRWELGLVALTLLNVGADSFLAPAAWVPAWLPRSDTTFTVWTRAGLGATPMTWTQSHQKLKPGTAKKSTSITAAGASLVFVAHYSLCFIGELCFYSTRDPIKLQLSIIILFSLELLIKDDVLLLAQSSSTVTKWHFLYFKWKQMCPSVV